MSGTASTKAQGAIFDGIVARSGSIDRHKASCRQSHARSSDVAVGSNLTVECAGVWQQTQWCPVKNRTNSIACRDAGRGFGAAPPEIADLWAFSRRWLH